MTVTILGLVVAAATGLSFVRPSSQSDYQRFSPLATAVSAPFDAAQWTFDAKASDLSLIAPLPAGRLLVGYTTQEQFGGNPHARIPTTTELVLHDVASGRPIWRTKVKMTPNLSLIAAEPLLVVLDDRGLRGIDPVTGAVAWTVEQSAMVSTADPAQGVAVSLKLLAKRARADDPRLVAVGLRDGKILWKAPVPAHADAPQLSLLIRADRLFLLGREVVVYDVKSGALLAEVSSLPQLEAPVRTRDLPDGILVGDAQGLLVKLKLDGSIAWRADLREPVGTVTADGKDALIVTSSGARAHVRLLAVETGKERWTHEDDLLATTPRLAAWAVIYTTFPRLVALDRSTGAELGEFSRSKALQRSIMPNRLVFSSDESQVTVVGETGLMAFSLQGGRPVAELWRIDLRGVEFSTLEAAQCVGLEYPNLALSQVRGSVSTAELTAPATAAAGRPPTPAASTYSTISLAHGEDFFYRNASDTRRTTSDRLDNLQMGQSLSLARVQTEFALSSLATATSMAGNVFAALARGLAELGQAEGVRQFMGKRRAVDLWSLAVQGDYFVRPLTWYFGEGVLIVDLRTGRWRELVTGPGEPVLGRHYTGSPPALLDPQALRVFTLVPAGNPAPLVEYPNIAIGAKGGAAFALTPPASWSLPQDYAGRSRAPPSFEELVDAE